MTVMKKKVACGLMAAALLLGGCSFSKTGETDSETKTETQTETQIETQTGAETETVKETDGRSDLEIMTGTTDYYAEKLRIEIINATDCPNGVYKKHMDFSVEGAEDSNGLTQITREQRDYLVSYILQLEEPAFVNNSRDPRYLYPDETEGHTYIGQIFISYSAKETSDGPTTFSYGDTIDIFDAFPEGYEEFINALNEADGGEPIMLGEPMVMSGELITKVTGITDEDVEGGTIDDVLNFYYIDTYSLMNCYRDDDYAAYYIRDNEVTLNGVCYFWPLYRALPWEQTVVESTEDELQAYAEKVAEALGEDPASITDATYGGKLIPGQNVRVFQTCNFPIGYSYSETYPYHLVAHHYYDGGELDKDERYTMFLSPDGKFGIAMNGCLQESYYGEDISEDEVMTFYKKIEDLVGTV